MAKDPAFLFYPGDWLQGTMGMTYEERGAYLDLLIFQFNNGRFTHAQAKQVLSICSASVFEKVMQKFNTDGTFFWKQRLEDEVSRRQKFSESRRNNAKGVKNKDYSKKNVKAYAKHMETVTETINKDEERKGVQGETEKFTDAWFDEIFDELLMESVRSTFPAHDLVQEMKEFKLKIRGSPTDYQHRDGGGIRQAFIYQLKNSKNGKTKQHGQRNKGSAIGADAVFGPQECGEL